ERLDVDGENQKQPGDNADEREHQRRPGSKLPARLRAVEHDGAGGRLVNAGNCIENGGLAGAVRPDDRGDGVGRNLEIESVDGGQSAETHCEMPDIKDAHDVTRLCAVATAADPLDGNA